MSLAETITAHYKEAFKAREDLRVQVLRMLRAEIHGRAKEKKSDLADQEVVAIIRTMIKQRKEAAKAFKTGGAESKAAQETAEAEILAAYLPAGLSDAELNKLIAEAVSEVGAKGMADMGKVMKVVMLKAADRADGKTVNQKVRQALSQ